MNQLNKNVPSGKQVWAWAWYDWGNSAFATTVIAGFFPVFLANYWAADMDPSDRTYWLNMVNAAASLLVALGAPILGSIADAGGRRKVFLAVFAYMGVLATTGLFFAAQGDWMLALALLLIGTVGFSGANVFYDSMLVEVAPKEQVDRVSALGYGMGYLGGGLLFSVQVGMTLKPEWFGLQDAAQAVRTSFLMVGLWWALFTIPLLLYVQERRVDRGAGEPGAVLAGWRQLIGTFRKLRKLKMVAIFLLAYWFYIDGVNTIFKMAVDYGIRLGFDTNDLIVALLVTQFVGFPAAVAFGRLAGRIGVKPALYVAIGVYIGVTAWATMLQHVWQFYAMAVIIGLVQGGLQALSRSYYSRLIPHEQAGEFYGFYNMLGKFAAVLGPLLYGAATAMTDDPRLAIGVIALLFVAGGLILTQVDETKAATQL